MNATRILKDGEIKVGDYVHQRTWSQDGTPQVWKKTMRVVAIDRRGIVCGGSKCFDAFELVKSDWKPR